ncbi:MAG: hypothetical protein JWO96_69 [Candidatus Saccharibacteria bacterium]|nr:hypothetical protein [Candidatus Saccharibacteria bacterium]
MISPDSSPVNHHPRRTETPVPGWLKDRLQSERGERATNRAQGWKLHLNFDADNPEIIKKISDCLEEQVAAGTIVTFKIGKGGGKKDGQPGKEATVYVGPKDRADIVAQVLQEQLDKILSDPEGDALEDDVPFTEKIMGRFEVSKVDPQFHQYGAKGFPLLKIDMASALWDKEQFSAEEARQRADSVLRERYGTFYTGSQ